MKHHTIIMARAAGGENPGGAARSRHLWALTEAANEKYAKKLVSPLTVTVGEEFQGVVENPGIGVDLLLWLERRLRRNPLQRGNEPQAYRLRYVLHEGEVEAALNPDRAHGMLGPGMDRARELLTGYSRGAPRMVVVLDDAHRTQRLSELFQVLDAIAEDWKEEHSVLIEAMLDSNDSVALGQRFDRHRTSIERRRRTLKIDAYLIVERMLREIAVE